MKKAQTAVPAVLLTVMGLILWYVLWIYPEQRYELLFGPQEEEVSQTPVSNVFYSTTVGEIGMSSGELLDNQITSDLSVSYPVTRNAVKSFPSQILTSSLIASEHKTVDLSASNADAFNVEVDSSTVTGTPYLRITLNNTLIYDNQLLSDSITKLDIPGSSIESYGNVLRIACQFNGYEFWTTQQCGFDSINVYEYVYAPIDVMDDDVFYLTPTSENAELVELSFTPSKTTNHPINLLLNGKVAYAGSLTEGEEVTLSLEGDEYNLGIDNNITLLALEGAEYELSDISMLFYSVPSGSAAKYLVFDVSSEVLDDESFVTINFNLTGVVEPGDLVFEFVNSDATYVLSYEELVIGSNSLEIFTSDLDENGNNLKLYSNTGRFIIDGLEVK